MRAADGGVHSAQRLRNVLGPIPFLSEANAESIFDLVVAIILHASRVGQINRCLSEARGLLKLLQPRGGDYGDAPKHASAASAITLKAQTLAEIILTERHYVAEDGTYDPRFLLFEFTHNLVLRQPQVQLVAAMVNTSAAHER